MNEGNAHDTQEFLNKRLNAIKSQRNSGELEDLALIIGQQKDIYHCHVSSLFLNRWEKPGLRIGQANFKNLP